MRCQACDKMLEQQDFERDKNVLPTRRGLCFSCYSSVVDTMEDWELIDSSFKRSYPVRQYTVHDWLEYFRWREIVSEPPMDVLRVEMKVKMGEKITSSESNMLEAFDIYIGVRDYE